jgi:serine/threonine-protein kinase
VGEDDTPAVAQVEVPSVIGKPVADATQTLEALKFKVETTSEANDDQAEGNVFDQSPLSGAKVDEGSTVTLKVSAGAEAIPVPKVIGSQIADARRLLSGLGFTVKEEPIPNEDVPVGEVVDQTPAPDDEAPRGSEVVLQVSSGPEERPVPDVAGRTVGEASNILGQNGFTADQSSEPSATVAEGKVIRTDPPANTPQPKGAVVTLVVSSGPEQVTVPSVTGLSEANAVSALQSKGFTVEKADANTVDPSLDATVKSQSPQGNTKAPGGSTVTITVWRFVGESPPSED